MAESESGGWGSWSQGWGGASSWGGSNWFDEPGGTSWSRATWNSQQPQEEPATFGDPWGSREARVEAKVEDVSKLPINEASVLSVADYTRSAEELAEERRRRIEAEAALAEERSSRERTVSELSRKVEDLEKRLAAAEASALEAAAARTAADEIAATAKASLEAANAEMERLKASAVASAEAMRERTNATPEAVQADVDWWTSNANDSKGDSWGRGWSGSTWSSPTTADSWQRWSTWPSSPERASGSVDREGAEASEHQRLDSVVREEAEVTREEAEPESESAPEIARQEDKRDPHENEEWYQKWLRRQPNRPTQTVELGKAEERPSVEQRQQVEDTNNESAVTPRSEDGRENEEWYQKWLRRQENRPRKIVYIGADQPQDPKEEAPQAEEPQPQLGEEQAPTIENEPSGESQAPPEEDSSKAYQNEEWYQKWLRRQKIKPRQIVELGVEKSQEQQVSQQDEQASQDAETAAASQPEESGKRGYENEEWYQKWLRRQKNKGREIIEIGVDRPQEEEPEDPSAERRLDPEDGKTYTWKGLYKRYKGHFPDDEIKAYWESDCKVAEASGEAVATENASSNGKNEEQSTDEPSDISEAKTAEPEQKPYEQEEWYQKWLRRQANKDRKIIEIG